MDQIKIDIFNSEKKIEIKDVQNGIVLLKLEYQHAPIITHLDLRHIGYNITGDTSKLIVGGTSVSGNTFKGVNTIIGLGDRSNTKTSPNNKM